MSLKIGDYMNKNKTYLWMFFFQTFFQYILQAFVLLRDIIRKFIDLLYISNNILLHCVILNTNQLRSEILIQQDRLNLQPPRIDLRLIFRSWEVILVDNVHTLSRSHTRADFATP
jgi:hypothetical protein